MQLNVYDIIKSPIITEKAMREKEEHDQYCFEVDRRANKNDVQRAVESIYGVDVVAVQIMNIKGKLKRVRYKIGRTAAKKKAIVRIKSGQKIDFI